MEEAIGSLPPQRRKVYELCKGQGKTYQQAAAELGISAHTVKEHMTKALSDLRIFFQKKGKWTLLLWLGQIILKKN